MLVQKSYQKINVVGICGSIRSQSYTYKTLNIILQQIEMIGAKSQMIDLKNYELSFCNGEKEANYTKDVDKLKNYVKQADAVILATPEYHGSYSGVLKNVLDLMGFNEFQNKMIGLIAVAGGKMGGIGPLSGLREVMRSLRAWVLPLSIFVPTAWNEFDHNNQLKNNELKDRLEKFSEQLIYYTNIHQKNTH